MTYYDQWILEDQLMMGAQIPAAEVYRHLIEEDGVTHILDLEKACDLRYEDPMKKSPRVLHMYYPDNGMERPDWFWRAGFEFALESIQDGGTVFVHCRMGRGRGPSMTYGILRYMQELPDERTSKVKAFDARTLEKVIPRHGIVYEAQIEEFLEEYT